MAPHRLVGAVDPMTRRGRNIAAFLVGFATPLVIFALVVASDRWMTPIGGRR